MLVRDTLSGMTTSESEEGYCRIMPLSLAGAALGVAGDGICTRGICFASSKPRYCVRVVQVLIEPKARGVIGPLEMTCGGALGDMATLDATIRIFSVVVCALPVGFDRVTTLADFIKPNLHLLRQAPYLRPYWHIHSGRKDHKKCVSGSR